MTKKIYPDSGVELNEFVTKNYDKIMNTLSLGDFDPLERAWDDMYASRYGFWRTYVMTVIYRYLDCGDLHMGFTRVRCEECGHEYLLAL